MKKLITILSIFSLISGFLLVNSHFSNKNSITGTLAGASMDKYGRTFVEIEVGLYKFKRIFAYEVEKEELIWDLEQNIDKKVTLFLNEKTLSHEAKEFVVVGYKY